MISPGEFIPVFERNGFILKLDQYVWEKTCQLLAGWRDEGRKIFPVSVNISRVSLYNPKIVDVICGLTEKYNIPPEWLQLELTESAYTGNPKAIKEMMEQLQKKGFSILMDDFGGCGAQRAGIVSAQHRMRICAGILFCKTNAGKRI